MMRLFLFSLGFVVSTLSFAQVSKQLNTNNPWLDSTQANTSTAPLYIANGIIISPIELNVDFVTSMNVNQGNEVSKKLGPLAKNGIIYIEADQQFDAITPQVYRTKKKLPAGHKTIVYMLNGCLIADTLNISKAAIRRVDLLSGSHRSGLDSTTSCLSIWTLTDDERGLPKPKNAIRIRGAQDTKASR